MGHFSKRLSELMAANPNPLGDERVRFRDAAPLPAGAPRERTCNLPSDETFYPVTWATDTVWDGRKRARIKGLEWNIDAAWIARRLERQGFACALTGIEFSAKRIGTAHKRPWMPSLDRIDCSKGYTPDNVRIVCVAVNTLLQDWGDGVLERILEACAKK